MRRALIVDGDPTTGTMLSELCHRLGLEVARVADAKSALDTLRVQSADLILLDLALPNGLGLLETLREEALEPEPAVLIVASAADTTGRLRAVELGALDFVDKPFRVADLSRRIERVLAVTDLEAKLRQAEQQLWDLRTADPATGVGHTNQLFEVLDGEFRWAQSSRRPLSCLVVSDERTNNPLHDPEDQARLHRVAALVDAGLAPTHRSFRVDVAELVVVLPGTARAELAGLVAGLLSNMGDQQGLDAADFAVGAASHPHPEITQPSHLYRAAIVALAQARSHTSQRVVLFDGFGPGTTE